MAVLARPQLDGSFDVTERRLPKIGCREWVESDRSMTTRSLLANVRYRPQTAHGFATLPQRVFECAVLLTRELHRPCLASLSRADG